MYSSLRFAHGDTYDMLRETVRDFAQSEIAPRAADIDRDNLFPADLWQKFGDLGLLADGAHMLQLGHGLDDIAIGVPDQDADDARLPR